MHWESYEITLSKGERKISVPSDAEERVKGGLYTFRIYTAEAKPWRDTMGVTGDVWVDASRGTENVYIKVNRPPRWVAWHQIRLYLSKGKNLTTEEKIVKLVHCNHPWYRTRSLQFDGKALSWYENNKYLLHRKRWDKKHRSSYDELDNAWIVRCLNGEAPRYAPTHLSQPNYSQLVSLLFDSGPGRPSSGHWSGASSTDEAESSEDGSEEEPQQHGREPSAGALPNLKRSRSTSPLLPPSLNNQQKRRRANENHTRPGAPHPSALVSRAQVAPASPAADPSLKAFLEHLSLPLSHRTETLVALGVTTLAHLHSLVFLPKHYLDGFMTVLQERGFTFMEALVLRDALNAYRRIVPQDVQAAGAGPETIEAFLAQLRPSMAHHAPVFRELGIDITHIPVLAELGADSYAEFERALTTRSFTWIETLIIKAGIQQLARAYPTTATPLPAYTKP